MKTHLVANFYKIMLIILEELWRLSYIQSTKARHIANLSKMM
jgi:hypothetical protein